MRTRAPRSFSTGAGIRPRSMSTGNGNPFHSPGTQICDEPDGTLTYDGPHCKPHPAPALLALAWCLVLCSRHAAFDGSHLPSGSIQRASSVGWSGILRDQFRSRERLPFADLRLLQLRFFGSVSPVHGLFGRVGRQHIRSHRLGKLTVLSAYGFPPCTGGQTGGAATFALLTACSGATTSNEWTAGDCCEFNSVSIQPPGHLAFEAGGDYYPTIWTDATVGDSPDNAFGSFTVTATPEPGAIVLVLTGLCLVMRKPIAAGLQQSAPNEVSE